MTVSTLYCQYDIYALAGVVGENRAKHLINKDKNVYMFVTGENNT